ncbi:MAG: hypothetical protein IJX28_01950 [Clostridia bacterium]|nr:hypothetical protein [Clostridia bacterium]
MKRLNRILWGVALVALGVVLGLNVMGVTDVEIFFDGWWTLFLIIPGFTGLLTEKDKTGNLVLLLLGLALLLGAQDVIGYDKVWKLALIAGLILIGLRMVFRGTQNKQKNHKKPPVSDGKLNCVNAVFGAQDINYDGQDFEGIELNAVFGGIECDLRHAIITKDVVIKANAVFGGVDIILPENVNLQHTSTSVFGGMDDTRHFRQIDGAVTVFVEGACVFGGVDIK